MYVVGIDFSINFPSLCICKDFTEFKWIACVNTKVSHKFEIFMEEIQSTYKNIKIIMLGEKILKKDTYSNTERAKLINYSTLVDTLISELKKEIGDCKDIIISIEGIAYGASGNALIDISQSTGMLRKDIASKILNYNYNRFFVFSPGELKNAIGAKGNDTKYEVYLKFIKSKHIASNSDLAKVINKNTDTIINEKTKMVQSPFMDMIDSYLAVLKIYNIINTPV